MIARESGIVAGLGWALAMWACWFTFDVAWRGMKVTSPQWRYLMSVPGHQWAWAAVFGTAALLLTLGMATRRYAARAAGLAIMGFGCGSIAAFYACAPLIDPGLTTLGYHPWLISAGLMLLGAVINWRPVAWF